MNKFRRVLIIIVLILTLALSLVLTSCTMDYKASELPFANLIKHADDITASSGTGSYAIDRAVTTSWSPKNTTGNWLVIKFKQAITFNAVALKEKHSAIKTFKIEIPDGDSWKTIFYSDGIGQFRLCTFAEVTTDELRLSVDNAFDKFGIREIAIYNLNNDIPAYFRKTAFINVASYKEMSATRPGELQEFLNFYDDIVLTDAINAIDGGCLSFAVSAAELKTIVSEITSQNKAKASINIVNNAAVNPLNNRLTCDTLVSNLLKLYADTGASVTLHWKNIIGAELWRAYNFLIKNLSDEFDKLDVDSTIKPSTGIILDNTRAELEPKTCKTLDKVYFLGNAATNLNDVYNDFYNNFYYATNFLNNMGFDKSKIVLTMPLYAHSISSSATAMPYSQLIAQFSDVNNWQNLYINLQHDGGYRDFYFQSPVLALDKAIYSRMLGLGGFGVIGLEYDLPMSHQLSITSTIAKALK